MTCHKGVVHGKTIVLDSDSGLPDGEQVTVIVRSDLPSGEGIRQSAGAWADGGKELDKWLELTQRSRQTDRPESAS